MNRWTLGLALLVLVLAGVIVWQHRKLAEQKSEIDDLTWTLKDGTAVLPTTVGTAGSVALAATAAGMPEVPPAASQSGVTLMGTVVVSAPTTGALTGPLPSSSSTPRPEEPSAPKAPPECPAEPQVMHAVQHLDLEEPLGGSSRAPWGRTSFSAWRMPKPWDVEVFPRVYQAATVVGTDEEGAVHAWSKLSVEVQGQTYPLTIAQGKTTTEFPSARFRFSPSLYAGADVGLDVRASTLEVAPAVQLGLWSYGVTKLAPDYALGLFGFGYATQSRAPLLLVSPVSVNVGAVLPWVDNIHLVPTFGVSPSGDMVALVGIRAKL